MLDSMGTLMRTHTCGEPVAADAGRTITVTMDQGTNNQDTGKQFPLCQ